MSDEKPMGQVIQTGLSSCFNRARNKRVVLIISLPRELRAVRAVAGAVANIEEAIQCAEGDFAVRRAF